MTHSQLHAESKRWLKQDLSRVEVSLGPKLEMLLGKKVLLTGAAGFLGFSFLHFFAHINSSQPDNRKITVTAVDNFLRGRPRWISELVASDPTVVLKAFDASQPWPDEEGVFDFVIHGASIASPKVYRQYPLETLDANIAGLRHMLELARRTKCKSILNFSSSEIYGDPPANEIPTTESYRGHVACIGPRACYDESKRVGETLCYLYAKHHGVPVKIVRPFNNYGPGLRLTDGRLLPDLCRDVLADRDIVLYSDGTPTRTFCYASDALSGYLLALLSPHEGEPFNIGTSSPEISIRDFSAMLLRVAGSRREIKCMKNAEAEYLTDNPQRRCPNISKAISMLGYQPQVSLEDGLQRSLEWYRKFHELEHTEDAART